MATVNLGSIKFKWKGTYSGATAYTIDDVVEYNGSSYICISNSTGNLPTNATYFEQMSAKGTDGTNGTDGTDGTDLTTTLTTQGDLVYRDASGLQRLGAGTNGQVLTTGGAGANPSWGSVSSDFVKLTDANGTTATTVDFTNVFNSTYNVYKIYGSGIYDSGGAGGGGIFLRYIRSTGVIETDTSYVQQSGYQTQNSTSGSTVNPLSYWSVNYYFIAWDGGGNSTRPTSFEITILNPNQTNYTKQCLFQSASWDGANVYSGIIGGSGHLDEYARAYTGISLQSNAGRSLVWNKLELYGIKA